MVVGVNTTTENPPVPFEFTADLHDVEQNLVQPVFVSAFLAVRSFHPDNLTRCGRVLGTSDTLW